jgi:phage minor structural protein
MTQTANYFQYYDGLTRPGKIYGIDISHYQYPMNFVTAYSHAARFVYMKSSEGTTYLDIQFTAANVALARGAGLQVGAYHYCNPAVTGQTTTAAVNEANWFVAKLQGVFGTGNYGDLVPVCDFEDPGLTWTNNDTAYNWIEAFVNQVKTASGRACMLYTGVYYAEALAAAPNGLVHSTKGPISNKCPLWLAAKAPDYTYNQPPTSYPNSNFDLFGGYGIPTNPNQTNFWKAWQFSSDGNGAGPYYGSTGDIDVDILDADLSQIMRPSQPVTTATSANTTITLNWTRLPDSDIYNYTPFLNGVAQPSTDSYATSYTYTGLTNESQYMVGVRATDRWEAGLTSAPIYIAPHLNPVIPPAPVPVQGIPGAVRMIDTLLIFDYAENLVAVLGPNDLDTPFYDCVHLEQLNLENSLSFKIPASNPKAQYIIQGNLVAFLDLDGYFQLFEIKIIDEIHELQLTKEVFCEHQILELLDEILWSDWERGQTATKILSVILAGTRWSVGQVTVGGTADLNMELQTKMDLLHSLITAFGTGDLQYRVVITGKAITGRYVDFLAQRGSITGKRFEYGKDTTSIKRQVDMTQIKTALYGYGLSQQPVGAATGRITFQNVVWTIAAGNPRDKPAGQAYLVDPTALARWGRKGGTMNRWGGFDAGDATDPAVILTLTSQALDAVCNPIFNYEMTIDDLERISGLEHEKVRIGDTVAVIDTIFQPPVYLSARVIEIDRHFTDPENDSVVLGTFKPLITQDGNKIRALQALISANEGIWTNGTYKNNLVVDHSFENISTTGADDGYEVFAANVTVGATNKNYGSKFWWQYRGTTPLILSTYSTNTLLALPQLALYDYQACVITSQSRPYQYIALVAAQGLNGPYTASCYVTAFSETTVNGTARLEIYACNSALTRLNGGVAVGTANTPIISTNQNVWARNIVTITAALPATTLYLEFNITGDYVLSINCKYLADGCQLVPLTGPVTYDPESSVWKLLRDQAGMTS